MVALEALLRNAATQHRQERVSESQQSRQADEPGGVFVGLWGCDVTNTDPPSEGRGGGAKGGKWPFIQNLNLMFQDYLKW